MQKNTRRILLLACCAIAAYAVNAQGYQALHGSAFTGSTSVFQNPSSLLQSAYRWDLTILSAQAKLSSNTAYLANVNGERGLVFRDGSGSRFAHGNADISLLNFHYKLNPRQAVAFNLRGRVYSHTKTLPFSYTDSLVYSINDFLKVNRNTPFLEGFSTDAAWLEADLTYAQVLSETYRSRLSGGVTLQLMKNVGGGFVKASKLAFLEHKFPNDTAYTFTNGRGSFAYSENFDSDNAKDAWKQSPMSLGLSLGIEYLLYDGTEEEKTPLNYRWKMGVALMDIGSHSFKASRNSRRFANPDPSLTDRQADNKINGANDAQQLADSIASMFLDNDTLTGNFSISQPTRLVLNVDRRIGDHFFINGELNINFYSTSNYSKLRLRELNLLTVTPRWETMGFGAYLPVQYNTQGQLWVGAALRLGPLTVGIHNLGTVLKKEPGISGGGYFLLSIHPFQSRASASNLDCF